MSPRRADTSAGSGAVPGPAGHELTVYEPDDRVRYGISEYRLEKATLNQRLAQMRADGT